jgi:prepilin-type N-terminal cleavage/methylation domain-containing protein
MTRFMIKDLRFRNKKGFIQLHRDSAGFTLIELLVVIAIIGILATIGVTVFISAQVRARDTQRKADLQKIQFALEMYRADNKTYPDGGNGNQSTPAYSVPTSDCSSYGGSLTSFINYSSSISNDCSQSNVLIYLNKLPVDPKINTVPVYFNAGSYKYVASCSSLPDGSTVCSSYTLAACLENTNDNGTNVLVGGASQGQYSGFMPSCTSNKYYVLTNP